MVKARINKIFTSAPPIFSTPISLSIIQNSMNNSRKENKFRYMVLYDIAIIAIDGNNKNQ